MITNPHDVTVTFVDNGLFVSFASRVAKDFKKVNYWTPWASAFPKSNNMLPGRGVDGVNRVRWLFDAIKESQLVIFPDVYFGDLQVELVRHGKLVWGSRKGEVLELDRMEAKEILENHGVTPSPGHLVVSMDRLREYLQDHENVWVKTSMTRGDFETFKSENYELSMSKLDEIEQKLGAKKYIYEFVIEPDISPAVEWGVDSYTIDGQWPSKILAGLEIKDLGYIGRVLKAKSIPQYLRSPHENLSPFFKDQQYRGAYSSEMRILKDRQTFTIDPTCRFPSPPSEIYQESFCNWADIFLMGAQGEVVDPEEDYEDGACALIHSSWADKNWQAVSFPEEIRPFVKLRNHCRIEGVDYCVPCDVGLPEIGTVIGLGDTMEQAIEHLNKNAEQVKGYYLDIKVECIQKALEEKEKANQIGLDI